MLNLFIFFISLSSENFSFWLEAECFKEIQNRKQRKQEAHRIYNKYLAFGCPQELNCSGHTRSQVNERLQAGKFSGLFDYLSREILELLENESIPKYARLEPLVDL